MYEPQIEPGEEARLVAIVREVGEISRLELAQRSGLGRNKVSATLKSLLDQHFLEEVGTGASSGGRPPSRVRFAKESGYLIGIDLGATSLDVAVTNLNAEPICHLSREIDVRDGPDAVMSAARADVERALDESGLTRQSLKGIGMGIPGPVEFATGRPVSPPIMPGWHLFPIREYLEGEFGCPVFVDNDVNMMITGERWAGAGRDAQNFIFVKLGSGIGCGIVSHGKIYRGAQGSAGDIGHIAVGDDPTVCRCGNLGCLELIAGGWALGKTAERLANEQLSEILVRRSKESAVTAVDLGVALAEGDPVVAEIVRQSGRAIGRVLASLVNFYNPELIVIGGGVAKIGDLLLAAIREAIYRRSLPLATRDIVICRSQLGDDAGVIGSAALVMGELYQLWPLGIQN